MKREKTFNVVTGKMTHFDCRDINDLIRSKARWLDFTATERVYDNQTGEWTDNAPEIEWNKEEQEKINRASKK